MQPIPEYQANVLVNPSKSSNIPVISWYPFISVYTREGCGSMVADTVLPMMAASECQGLAVASPLVAVAHQAACGALLTAPLLGSFQSVLLVDLLTFIHLPSFTSSLLVN